MVMAVYRLRDTLHVWYSVTAGSKEEALTLAAGMAIDGEFHWVATDVVDVEDGEDQ